MWSWIFTLSHTFYSLLYSQDQVCFNTGESVWILDTIICFGLIGGIVFLSFPAWDAVEINWKLASSVLPVSWSLTATSRGWCRWNNLQAFRFVISKTPSYHRRRISAFLNVKKLHFLYLAHFSNSDHFQNELKLVSILLLKMYQKSFCCSYVWFKFQTNLLMFAFGISFLFSWNLTTI